MWTAPFLKKSTARGEFLWLIQDIIVSKLLFQTSVQAFVSVSFQPNVSLQAIYQVDWKNTDSPYTEPLGVSVRENSPKTFIYYKVRGVSKSQGHECAIWVSAKCAAWQGRICSGNHQAGPHLPTVSAFHSLRQLAQCSPNNTELLWKKSSTGQM